ncbi:MAG TPA: chemotaxis protein CheW [Geminicoccus sp.]|jgi:two-component system chemotaxis sensor kinase CheA|uniref:hybrid sensor histidine kinase/response regulator n=1 Tax=Geminicoccus sp. TaxID=2024832 RepID=UPI002E3077C0|nr:chemotaxis protein CheW [Geminicoccus sp.]HEX2529793.1 chemotaxis protein CheW [Geminicoccus sp.]
MDELLADFLTECAESMTLLDVELVKLERNPSDRELLGSIFRMVHTIKGTCGFLGLPRLQHVAHAAENVLGDFREGKLVPGPSEVSLILEALDRIKEILAVLEATRAEPAGDDSELIARLDACSGRQEEVEPIMPNAVIAPGSETLPARTNVPAPETEGAAKPVLAAKNPPEEAAGRAAATESVAHQTLRVNIELLEKLMTLVSELVLTRNQLLQTARKSSDNALKAPLQRLSHITSELQEGVMKTRMQPIGNVWSKLPRVVRDLGMELGKQIELEMVGADTELDRQILELIKDPLTHMVRNSADHGLETTKARVAAGKPEQGKIRLNAFHEGGHIIIEIADDGKGLDTNAIAAKILANGLATEAELASLSTQQIQQFIFKAGFSTARQVTNVSGRGVGMDVVRTNIEKIGGTIEMSSELGRGTRFVIKIPLTLAIVSALIVAAAGERYAIPQIGVVELVRAGARSKHRIEVIDGAPILRLRDRLLPLISLAGVLGLRGDETNVEDTHVVVSQIGPCVFGLIVDQVFDTEEIVVKPVAPILRGHRLFSGNTILGDGDVVMILDLNGLTDRIGKSANPVAEKKEASSQSQQDDATSLLLFRAGAGAPKAVPLALVTRLEEIEPAQIEWSGTSTVVQYRGRLMPIVDFEGQPVRVSDGTRPVLVFTDAGNDMGLVVDSIIDITEQEIRLECRSGSVNVLGSAIIAGRSTEVVDVSYFVNQVFGGWFDRNETEPFMEAANTKPRRILLVDDSAFFRNILLPILQSHGYEVTAVDSAAKALEYRDKGEMYDAIVSDIEMPGMDGFAFAACCRADGSWQNVPMVALTSHTAPKDIERGREAGFDGHVGKLDREALVAELASHPKAHRVPS